MMTDAAAAPAGRPPVSVVVPFLGDERAAREALDSIAALELRPGDELVIADNSPTSVVEAAAPAGSVRVVRAGAERSAYHARNRGAAAAANDWLLFLDADCRPAPDLVERYFEEAPAALDGVVAGRIESGGGQPTLAGRWAAARRNIDQRRNLSGPAGGVASGNMLVRRATWLDLGGFLEGLRSGADLEFCWRAQDAGWSVAYRDDAVVEHPPQARLGGLARQIARWAAGNAWQQRRRPGASPRPPLAASLLRSGGGATFFALSGRLERGRLKLVDGIVAIARELGRLAPNAAPKPELRPAGDDSVAIFTDLFPAVSETFIAGEARALTALGWRVRIEAAARPDRPLLGAAGEWRVDYLEDAGVAERLAALAWLLAHRPLRAAADPLWRRRLPAPERLPLRGIAPLARRLTEAGDRHVHVHFSGPAAAHALRAGRLAGVGVSVAVHGYDIYASPSGLSEKLAAASFVAVPCDYVRREIEAIPAGRGKAERIVMGVDGERFRRTTPHPGGRTVVAIGRYVEKKGFAHLLEAASILRRRGQQIDLVLAGEGPLRAELVRRAESLGLGESATLPRADGYEAVRALLERADLLAMPSVIAADGDRDSMPVVVKEALAMEVPVVASDEVGLPEMVEPAWGRLVPPADPEELADAIAEMLALPAAERVEMGRRGRAFVLEHCNPEREAERLAAAIRAALDR